MMTDAENDDCIAGSADCPTPVAISNPKGA